MVWDGMVWYGMSNLCGRSKKKKKDLALHMGVSSKSGRDYGASLWTLDDRGPRGSARRPISVFSTSSLSWDL